MFLIFNFAEVFISYKWEEGVPDFVSDIVVELEKRGISYWKDDHQIIPGDKITKRIVDGITRCTVFVPILSKGYVSEKGEKWCKKECADAANKEKIIVPIQWGETEIPAEIEFMIRPDRLRAKYDPEASLATRKQQIKEICDAVEKQLCKCFIILLVYYSNVTG